MTTKVLSGSYPTSYYLKSPITLLSITSTGYVGGSFGVYTAADPPNTYTVINDGKVAGTADGVYLGDGGLVTNGSATDTTATISGNEAVGLQQAGSVVNFGSIISKSATTGEGIYFNSNCVLTNGSAKDTSAYIEGHLGVLLDEDNGVPGVALNFGTIAGYGGDSVGMIIVGGGTLTNGSVGDRLALVTANYGVKGLGAGETIVNYGTIQSFGTYANASGVYLEMGGVVTNGNAADLGAEIQGVLAKGAPATVTNFGKIFAEPYGRAAVALNGGGRITNGSPESTTALIVGTTGVDLGAPATIANYGTIDGFGLENAGVFMFHGGGFTNGATGDASALIEGYNGVFVSSGGHGVNLATIQASGGYGLVMYETARVTNGSASDHGALISGWFGAELFDSSTLNNFGVVAGAGGIAVILRDAATRLNAAAGSVFEGQIVVDAGLVDFATGVSTASGIVTSGTVEGSGAVTLQGGASTFSSGVHLDVARINVAGTATTVAFSPDTEVADAEVWDQSGGTVSIAKGDAVTFSGKGDVFSGTLIGGGAVIFSGGSDSFSGVDLALAGQTITNAAAVTLSGAINLAASATVAQAGVVVAAGGATLTGGGALVLSEAAKSIVSGATAAATLTNEARIRGAGLLGNGKLTLVNAAAGTINGDLTIGALTINTGANIISNAGVIEATAAGSAVIKSAVDNTGTLNAQSGNLTVDGAVTGAGVVDITAATADFASSFSQNVDFTGATGTLELAKSQTYAGAISGFSKSGKTALDLDDIAFVKGTTSATFKGTTTSGVLTVTDGTHTAKITLEGDYTASKWTLSSDGHGGTKIVDPAGGPAATAAVTPFIAAAASFAAPQSMTTTLAAEAWRPPPTPLGAPRAQIA